MALAVVIAGLVLGAYTIVAPLLLGGLLLFSGFSLLSSRLNPLSPHFYSDRKPSWPAIGAVFLASLVLLADVYYLWKSRYGSWLPHL